MFLFKEIVAAIVAGMVKERGGWQQMKRVKNVGLSNLLSQTNKQKIPCCSMHVKVANEAI